MVALTEIYKSKARFFLMGTGGGIPAGDKVRIEEALNEIPDDTQKTLIEQQIDRCENRYTDFDNANTSVSIAGETYAGDITRTVLRSQRNLQIIKMIEEAFYAEVRRLANLLWCPYFTVPGDFDVYRYARSGGTYVNSLPGLNGAPGFHLPYLWDGGIGVPDPKNMLANANLNAATSLSVSKTSKSNIFVDSALSIIGAGSYIELVNVDTGDYVFYEVNGISDSGSYKSISVTHLVGTTTAFSTGSTINLCFISTTSGAAGDLLGENAQIGTTYTLALVDQSKMVSLTNGSAITLTIPTNASVALPVGCIISLLQGGAGQVTVTPAGGVTLLSADSFTNLRVQYSTATLWKQATDTWYLAGDLA